MVKLQQFIKISYEIVDQSETGVALMMNFLLSTWRESDPIADSTRNVGAVVTLTNQGKEILLPKKTHF